MIQVDSLQLWMRKSRLARANSKIGVQWRHASFELFACTFRAMHATNFVHIKHHSVCRFVVRHRHRSLVNNSPFGVNIHIHLRAHNRSHAQQIAYVTHFALKFKPYCLRWVRVQGKYWSDVCYLASVNDANMKWKSTLQKWESENEIMFISRTQPAEWYCLNFPRNRIRNAKTPYAVLVPFLHIHTELLKGQRMKWRKKPYWFSSSRIWYNRSDYEFKRMYKKGNAKKTNSLCSARFTIHDSPAIYQTDGVYMCMRFV